MPRRVVGLLVFGLCLIFSSAGSSGQAVSAPSHLVLLTVVDENGVPVADVQITVSFAGLPPILLFTDYLGRANFESQGSQPYRLRADAPGFYEAMAGEVDPRLPSIRLTLEHQQIVREKVNVEASTPGIDPLQTSDKNTMSTPEIVNIPYPTSRDIRNLLPFNPGVIQDGTGQAHLAGSETYAVLDLLDGFDIRSSESGNLALRVSTDAVRSLEIEKTRYPVEFGRAAGGVVSFSTGMGDNRFRFNATDFVPSFREIHGLHFDKFAPRVTFSGPLARNRAWFLDGFEFEYDNVIIPELPENADSDHLWRGSNLAKAQTRLSPEIFLIGGLLFNAYHSPFEGISALTPQQSATKTNILAWFPNLREQHSFPSGALLDLGVAVLPIVDGYEPHGDLPFAITPELSQGSYFENLTSRSRRAEGTASFYLPSWKKVGRHDWKGGLEADQTTFREKVTRAPIRYLREDGSLLRLSEFPQPTPVVLNNFELAGYIEDRWAPGKHWLIEPGFRLDWDEIVRRALSAPRIAATYSPGSGSAVKISAGIGLYYEHTQLEYLAETLAGIRYDTYYAADGLTPVNAPLESEFTMKRGSLRQAQTWNGSLGVEAKLPGALYAEFNFLQKRTTRALAFANQNGSEELWGDYLLTNGRRESYRSEDWSVRRSFAQNYVVFASYTHSAAHTNAALEYVPTLSVLGPQQAGPLLWDTPNRVLSWGWLPTPKLRSWDFVYTVEWRTGFPFISVNANQQAVGPPGSRRYPSYLSFSPGLEWKFHFHGSYFGLRGVVENITDRANPTIVNNNVDSPQYGMFAEPEGRAFTARIRLIGTK